MEENKKMLVKVRAVILHEGKLLAVKHPGYDEDLVALPGGHLEWGEELHECLSREMIEELGVKPEIGKLLYIHMYISSRQDKQYFEFLFEVKNGKDYLNIQDLERTHAHELTEIIWIDKTDEFRILPEKFGEDFKADNLPSSEPRCIRG